MNRFKRSAKPFANKRTWYLVIGISLMVVLLFVAATPIANARAARLANQAQVELQQGSIDQAIADFQIATIMAPGNHNYKQSLAKAYLAANRPNDAARTLQSLPIGESGLQIVAIYRQSGQLAKANVAADNLINTKTMLGSAYIAKSQIQLEQGRGDSALASARSAIATDAHNPSAQLQLGLCYGVLSMNDQLRGLIGSVSSPQAVQALKQANQGKTALSYQLYASGLLRSARAILVAQPGLSVPDYNLLGQIDLTLAANDTSKLKEAETTLIKATLADPSNLDSHKLLRQVYLKQQNTPAATHQADLINQLETGKV